MGGKSDLMTWGILALAAGAVWYFGINPETRKIDLLGSVQSVIPSVAGDDTDGAAVPARTEIPTTSGIKKDTTNLDMMQPIDVSQLNNERPKVPESDLSNIIPRLPSQAYATDYYTDTSQDIIYQTIAGAY
jgi:hypothetical protein